MSLTGGMVIGISLLIFVVWLYGKVRYFKKFNPIAVVVIIGLILSIVSLTAFAIVAGKVSIHVVALVAAFAVGVALMAVWTGGIKYIQNYLTFKSGVLIRLGLLVFIVSKSFQLIYM